MPHKAEPYDHGYWKDGIDLSKWGAECGRGHRDLEEQAAHTARQKLIEKKRIRSAVADLDARHGAA